MRLAYLDCFSGISGDMLLGALMDCGYPEEDLRRLIGLLGLDGIELTILPTPAGGIGAVRVEVTVGQPQPPRRLQDIEILLTTAPLPEAVQESSLKVFRCLAEAEAAVHGCGIEEVHFHETGAADALVDVVGAAAGLHHLGIARLICSPLPMPRGWVGCSHGDLPLPAPAVCELLRDLPVYGEDLEQELVTPTGAAVVRALAADFGVLPPMRMKSIGYGAGSRVRNDGRPNLLRLITGQSFTPDEAQQITVIETAVDDWNPETWPYIAEELLANGALDVLLLPVQMKKGRPGHLVQVICEQAAVSDLQAKLLAETSTIGLRYHRQHRITLPREQILVETCWGPVQAKRIVAPHGTVITPEYEDCRRLARENKLPLREVYAEVSRRGAERKDS
jgi:uncharacterized protein (TIGR00299 family) protein